jgi:dTDP-4-amino-4,6-dideoxygalactose transaminase
MNLFKPISISLSPNTEKDDILLAFKLLFQPWKWKQYEKCSRTVEFEEEFGKYLGVKYAISFNSGRSALMAILDALNIKEGDEILLQAFTCNSAVNPILNRKAKPVFVDIDNTLNIDPEDLKKKITPHSKAVMIQHTFGWPAQIEEILKIARQNNLFLIEDCAHSLGAKYGSRAERENHPAPSLEGAGSSTFQPRYASGKVGTFGDAAFFSFGRDKIISSVFGGMAATNNEEIEERIKNFRAKLDYPSNFWIFQQLLHPILVNYLILPAYGLNQYLGRILLGLFHQLLILSKAVYKKEKRGEIPNYFPKKFPNALANLALNQFRKLDRFNEHRRKIAAFYERGLKNTNFILPLAKSSGDRIPIFMRYPILTNFDTDKILEAARKRKIYLDDGWRKSPVVPPDTNLEKMKYNLGSCPRAEKIAKSILNLPTHINISLDDAKKIVEFLRVWK